MKRILFAAICAVPLLASAQANLVSNGSFETGLTGWGLSGAVTDGYPVVVIPYNSTLAYPNGAFGEPVPANNSGSISPDLAGLRAAYFVSDFSTQVLSQSIHLEAGTYQIGFSAYAPANGYRNGIDAIFTGAIAGVTLANYNVGSGPSATWQSFSGQTTITSAGTYAIDFGFTTNGNPAKDLVIDRVYVIAAPVPEPETYAMLLAGLGLMGAVVRRRRQQQLTV